MKNAKLLDQKFEYTSRKSIQRSIRARYVCTARDHSTRVDDNRVNVLSVACDLLLDLSFLLFSHAFFSQGTSALCVAVKPKKKKKKNLQHVFSAFTYLCSSSSSSSPSSSSYIVVVCLCCLFWLCVSLCCQSFSGSVTVTMAGSTQTAQTGNTGHATVNTNSQTHTSSEQQLPVPTPLHYPCKICGK